MKDNIDRLLDVVENHDSLSDKELDNLLEDPETRELYRLMSKAADALCEPEEPDIDAEWQKFAASVEGPTGGIYRRVIGFLSRRNVAAAIICVLVSLAAVAVTIGIKYSFEHTSRQRTDAVSKLKAEVSAGDKELVNDTAMSHPITERPKTVVFKDETLENILSTMGEYYSVKVIFSNPAKKGLHLYFQWDPQLPLADVVEQFNSFGQINIRITDNGLTIE